jgi:hypothetical protein
MLQYFYIRGFVGTLKIFQNFLKGYDVLIDYDVDDDNHFTDFCLIYSFKCSDHFEDKSIKVHESL